jgi:hypothetical protein
MYENQENAENQEQELTTEQKLEAFTIKPVTDLLELATTKVKPLADVLGLDVKFFGYVDNSWVNGGDEVTIRQELEHLHKNLKSLETEKQGYYERLTTANRKVSSLEDYLDENWDDIDGEIREKLCEIFDIEDTVTKTVSITITGTLEVTAPRGYDWDNIDDDLEITADARVTNSELDEAGYGFSHDDTDVEVD